MITSRDAVIILENNGFRVPNGGLDSYGEITYNGERVGTLYDDEIFIAVEFPNIRNKSYRDTKKQGSVKLSSKTARSDLKYCIQVLLKSLAAFEEDIRAKRVRNVQRYFQKKKEQLMNSMMGRLSDALNEVGTDFKYPKED